MQSIAGRGFCICGAVDNEQYPNLRTALALSIEVIQEAKETIFVPRCATAAISY